MAVPAQRRARRRAPVFYVPVDAPHRAHDILDDVRAGERTPQFRRQSELCYGEHLVEPFQDRGENALPVLFEMPGKVAKSVSALPASSSSHACRNTQLNLESLKSGASSPRAESAAHHSSTTLPPFPVEAALASAAAEPTTTPVPVRNQIRTWVDRYGRTTMGSSRWGSSSMASARRRGGSRTTSASERMISC